MGPETFALALLITFLATTIIDWVLSPVPQRRPIVVMILLVLSLVWVLGVEFVMREGE